MKQKYYRLDKMDKNDAQYKILLGENSNGKSYAVKERLVQEAFDDQKLFVYMRRYEMDTKPSKVSDYFGDCPISAITKGQWSGVDVWRGKIWLTRTDDEKNKTIRSPFHIGYVVYLSGYEHFKSIPFPNVENVVFEEFVTFGFYLDNEPDMLQRFISIIARRRRITVYMIANTISRVCPYFNEWSLTKTPTQKQGTIESYIFKTQEIDENGENVIVKIAVEFCENSGRNAKMFFGKVAENINGGMWASDSHPHLSKKREEYRMLYELELRHMGFSFVVQLLLTENRSFILYVYPFTNKRKIKRIIMADIDEDRNHSLWFNPEIPLEKIMIQCINDKKIFFVDNLTGTDFWSVLKELKRV